MIILTLGYKKYAISEKALEFVKNMCEVEEKRVGNRTKFYVIKEDDQPNKQIQVIYYEDLVNIDDTEAIAKNDSVLLKEEQGKADQYSKWWQEERKKTAELTAKINALQALCPKSHIDSPELSEAKES